MKNTFIVFVVICVGTVFFQQNTAAQDVSEKNQRLEAKFSYEYLNPKSVYGTRETFDLYYYNKHANDLTYFLQLGIFDREEGKALLGGLGAYKDWKSNFYTYSALSIGTNSEYLPRFRIDNDFNFKVGPEKNIVLTAGITYIEYFDVHEDVILSAGLTYYQNMWVSGYRFFRNHSDPGDSISYSHLVNIAYGSEESHWTYLIFSYGNQAYLATSLSNPEEIDQDALSITLKHRRRIKDNYGVILETGFFELEDGYKKYLFAPGVFMEF